MGNVCFITMHGPLLNQKSVIFPQLFLATPTWCPLDENHCENTVSLGFSF